MISDDRILESLGRIDENQRKALDAQQQQLQIAKAQLDRSNKTTQESIELQRTAAARQVQITRIVLPLVGVLLVLLVYLLVKHRVF